MTLSSVGHKDVINASKSSICFPTNCQLEESHLIHQSGAILSLGTIEQL